MLRKQLNHKIRAIAHGTLGLDEETYRSIVASVEPNSEGHITRCDDEMANLVLLSLKKMVEQKTFGGLAGKTNGQQHKFIARLMDHLRWNWQDTASFCEKVTGKRSTKQCSAAELSKIIRGMIAIIDHDIEAGKIHLTHTQAFEYERHVKHHRQRQKYPVG